MTIIKNTLGWVVVAICIFAIVEPLEKSHQHNRQLLVLDMTSMKRIAEAVKEYVSTEHKVPPSDNAALANELSGQHDLLNPNKNAVLLNGIIYDPWTKPYHFTLSEHSIQIDSSQQHYEESF